MAQRVVHIADFELFTVAGLVGGPPLNTILYLLYSLSGLKRTYERAGGQVTASLPVKLRGGQVGSQPPSVNFTDREIKVFFRANHCIQTN